MKKINFTIILLLYVVLSNGQDTTSLQPLRVSPTKNNKIVFRQTIKIKEGIKECSGNDVPVLISRLANITYYSDGGNYTGYMYYRIRGIDQTRINATLNDIPLNEPEDQGAYFSNYPDFSSNISYAEVQKGIGSNGVLAYAGVLKMETKNPLDSQYRMMDATIGSFNSKLFGVTYNSGLKDNFAMYARFSKLTSDGYRDHSGTNGSTFFFSGGYYKKKTEVKFTSFFGKSENQQAYLAVDEDVLKQNRKYNPITPQETDNFYQNLNIIQLKYNINDHWKLNTSIFYNKLIGTYKVLIDSTMSNFGLNSNFYGWLTTLNYKKDNWNILIGSHINFYDRQHLTTYDLGQVQYKNTGYKNEQSTYAKIMYTYHKFLLFGNIQWRDVGYRYEKTMNYELKIPTKYWTFLNWKVGINRKISNRLDAYTYIGQSSKEPTRTALLGAYDDIDSTNLKQIGNFNLVKPETVFDFEVGLNYSGWKKDLHLTYYNMQFTNEIAPIGQLNYIGQPLSKNVKHSKRTGLELNASYEINNTKIILNACYNFANIKKYVTDYNGQEYVNRFPLLSPKVIGNIGIEEFLYENFSINISERFISQSWLDNENTQHLPMYIQTNGYISYEYRKTRVLFTMNNIFNRNNYNSGYMDGLKRAFYVAPSRNISISIKQNF